VGAVWGVERPFFASLVAERFPVPEDFPAPCELTVATLDGLLPLDDGAVEGREGDCLVPPLNGREADFGLDPILGVTGILLVCLG